MVHLGHHHSLINFFGTVTQESLVSLYDALTRKVHTAYHGERVGPGWLKYEFNDSTWNLDDGVPLFTLPPGSMLTSCSDSDYTIFGWRQHQPVATGPVSTPTPPVAGSSTTPLHTPPHTPTLHLHNPAAPLPSHSEYRNPSYYIFKPQPHRGSPVPSTRSKKSQRTKASRRTNYSHVNGVEDEDDGIPKHKKEFEKFHGENGVRTVMGSIGPVQNGTSTSIIFVADSLSSDCFSSHAPPRRVSARLPLAQICY